MQEKMSEVRTTKNEETNTEYSLPQVPAAGLSWGEYGDRLSRLYGEHPIITDSDLIEECDFDSLEGDNRLLNLRFIKRC